MQKNILLLSGVLAKSELRYTQEQKAVCHYYLSQTDGKGNSQTLLCRAEGELAEKVSKINENSYITVIGRMETKKYAQNGRQLPVTEVVTTEVYPVGQCINKVYVAGRFSQENSYYASTENKKSFLKNSIATTYNKGSDSEHTEFLSCVFFDKVADFVSKYFSKGSEIWAEGKLNLENYTDKEGINKVAWKISVFKADFLGSKKSASSVTAPPIPGDMPFAPQQPAVQQSVPASVPPTADGFVPVSDGFVPAPSGWGNLPI